MCTYILGQALEKVSLQSHILPFLHSAIKETSLVHGKSLIINQHQPNNTVFVGVCIFFFDKTTTIAELAIRVTSIKNGAMMP